MSLWVDKLIYSEVGVFVSWWICKFVSSWICKLMSKCIQQLLFLWGYRFVGWFVLHFIIEDECSSCIGITNITSSQFTSTKRLRQRLNLLQKNDYSPTFRLYLGWFLLLFTRGHTALCYQQTKWKCQTRAKSIT